MVHWNSCDFHKRQKLFKVNMILLHACIRRGGALARASCIRTLVISKNDTKLLKSYASAPEQLLTSPLTRKPGRSEVSFVARGRLAHPLALPLHTRIRRGGAIARANCIGILVASTNDKNF